MLPTLPALPLTVANPTYSNAQDAIQLTDSQLERLAVARAQFIRRWG